jgi:dihydrofolate reductase
MSMRISLIVAKSQNNVIGIDGKLPWHLKDDLQYFKKITTNHHILMGRKTFESLPNGPLPQRMHLVVSNQSRENTDNVFWFTSILRAIKHAERQGEKELFIIGGAQIYKNVLSLVDRIYLTEVQAVVAGDTYFPELSLKNWKNVSSSSFEKSDKNDYSCSISILDRKELR